MKLGILSDTHGHLERTHSAIQLLKDRGAQHLIHCGDVGSELVLDQLFEQQETGTPVTVVPGNVDEWDPGFMLYAKTLGFPFTLAARLEIEGTNIAVHHGHHASLMEELTSDPELDLLFTGHTHVAQDEKVGQVRVINPGAVYRASIPSVAVLDTEGTGGLEYLPL